MIEKIYNKKKLYALIVRNKFRKKRGTNFFTDNKAFQQVGFIKQKKDYIILPHKHNKRKKNAITKIDSTTEVLIILKGILRVDFYDNKEKYLLSKKLYTNDLIILLSGGHGFRILKDVEIIEVKQGPYFISQDKVKFDKTDESQIKIK